VEAIVAKLTALGWSDEPWMSHGTLASQIRRYPSVVVAKNLTPRDYRELEPVLLSQLNADKHAHIVRSRLWVFQSALPAIITQEEIANLALDIPPSRPDIALIPSVRELLDKEGDTPVEKDQLVATLRPLMPTLLQSWIGDTLIRIGQHAREALNSNDVPDASVDEPRSSSSPVLDPLSLAIAFVVCPRNCGAGGHIHTLLKHSCTTFNWLNPPSYYGYYESNPDPYQAVAERVFYGERRFTPTIFDFKSRLYAVEGVIKAYGRDPKTTTVADMAVEGRLVNCAICVAKAKDPRERSKPGIASSPMDWLAAMDHSLKGHRTERDEVKVEWEISGETSSSGAVV